MLVGFEARNFGGISQLRLGLESQALAHYLTKPESRREILKRIYPLTPITALIGPNGSGKSTILTALNCLSLLFSEPIPVSEDSYLTMTRAPQAILGMRPRHIHRVEERVMRWIVYLLDRKHRKIYRYDLALELDELDPGETRSDAMHILAEALSVSSIELGLIKLCAGKRRSFALDAIEADELAPTEVLFYRRRNRLRALSKHEDFSLDPTWDNRPVAALVQNQAKSSALEPLRAYFSESDSAAIDRFAELLSGIELDLHLDLASNLESLELPDIRDIVKHNSHLALHQREAGHILAKLDADLKRNRSLKQTLSDLSGAEKRALVILDHLQKARSGSIFAFESPEQNLYPDNVEILAAAIRRVTHEVSNSQIFLTSHYPNFLDHFSPKEIWCFQRSEDESGGAVIKPPYCLAENELVREMLHEGVYLSQLWYGGYF
ncbi:MAG: AAA family ATPase [Eubacteriales bacterium]|nr:AAA family ATPase [Eubacteriales bacterium]